MRIWIDTQNDAFQGGTANQEVALILEGLANRIRRLGLPESGEPQSVRDTNGNTCGGYCDSSDTITSEQWESK